MWSLRVFWVVLHILGAKAVEGGPVAFFFPGLETDYCSIFRLLSCLNVTGLCGARILQVIVNQGSQPSSSLRTAMLMPF